MSNGGKQYIAVLSGVGGWAGIGLAAGLTDPTAGLGAVGGYAALSNYTALGGTLDGVRAAAVKQDHLVRRVARSTRRLI